ncbi:unnamed protein product [Diamesa serratosioi]
MSLKRIAVVMAAATASHNHNKNNTWMSLTSGTTTTHVNHTDLYSHTNHNYTSGKSYNNQGLRVMRPGGPGGNVNILLGGAMLSVVTTIVCLICYCCHRKIKMRSSSSLYRQRQWVENDPNMEIYSVEQYFDTSGLYESDNLPTTITHHNEPPPSYDIVMALDEVISRKRKNLYTFKGFHHHHREKDYNGNDDDNNEDNLMPQVTTTLYHAPDEITPTINTFCNCNCTINQNYASNLCTNCSNIIITNTTTDQDNNNVCSIITSPLNENINPLNISNCQLQHNQQLQQQPENDLLYDQLNNNNDTSVEVMLENCINSPSTSNTNYNRLNETTAGTDNNCRKMSSDDDSDEDDIDMNGNVNNGAMPNRNVNLETINRNGLIRLDMSQIIDHTGLPTYEAAIKLESSGYV